MASSQHPSRLKMSTSRAATAPEATMTFPQAVDAALNGQGVKQRSLESVAATPKGQGTKQRSLESVTVTPKGQGTKQRSLESVVATPKGQGVKQRSMESIATTPKGQGIKQRSLDTAVVRPKRQIKQRSLEASDALPRSQGQGQGIKQRSLELLDVPLESKLPMAISPSVMRRLHDDIPQLMGSPNMDRSWSLEEVRPHISSPETHVRRPKIGDIRTLQEHKKHEEMQRELNFRRQTSQGAPDVHQVRSFCITRKGLVKEGQRTVSNHSFGSQRSRENGVESELAMANSDQQEPTTERYNVLLLGAEGVGKRALVHEFILPDSDPFMSFSSDDDEEHTISILLDGREATMIFVEISDEEEAELPPLDDIDACVVVYSVEDRCSFEMAIDRLFELRDKDKDHHLARILVANKTDLVRTRVVLPQEGRVAADSYSCKYIEVSVAIDHQVDELLVGILQQIRLYRKRSHLHTILGRKQPRGGARSGGHPHKCCPLTTIKRQNLFARLLHVGRGCHLLSKSCDNLYVL